MILVNLEEEKFTPPSFRAPTMCTQALVNKHIKYKLKAPKTWLVKDILGHVQVRYSKPPLLLLEMSGQFRNVSSFTGFQIVIEESCSSFALFLSFSK